MESPFKRIVSAFICLIFFIFTGCSSITLIKTHPSEALVYIDGIAKEVSPYYYWDRDPFKARHRITLIKPGYETVESEIRREKFAFRRLFIFFLIVPLFYLYDYPESYFYPLEEDNIAAKTR